MCLLASSMYARTKEKTVRLDKTCHSQDGGRDKETKIYSVLPFRRLTFIDFCFPVLFERDVIKLKSPLLTVWILQNYYSVGFV